MTKTVVVYLSKAFLLVASFGLCAESDKDILFKQIASTNLANPSQSLIQIEKLRSYIEPNNRFDLARYYELQADAYSALGYGSKTLKSAESGLKLLAEIKSDANTLLSEELIIKSKLFISKADAYYFLNNYSAAYIAAQRSLDFARESQDKKQVAFSLISVAEMADLSGQHDKSLSFLLEANELSELFDDNYLKAVVYSTMGNIYVSLENNEQAILNFQKALQFYEPKNIFSINILNFNIANALYQSDKNEQALHYLQRVIDDSQTLSDRSTLAYAYFTQSEIYAEQKQYNKAIFGLNEAERLIRSIQDTQELFNILTTKLNIYIAMEELDTAQSLLLEMQEIMGDEPNVLQSRDWHFANSTFWAAKNDFEKAHFHALEYALFDHTYMLSSASQEMQQLRVEFNTKELELESEKLRAANIQKEIALTKSNAEKLQYWYVALISSMILICTIVFLYRQNKVKQAFATLAAFDELTGLRNRRSTKEFLEKEFDRFLRYQETFCVALFDIDDFKKFNDLHGHATGDQVLTRLGRKLPRLLRANDILCRWGGEEFLLLLPNTHLQDAVLLGERLLDCARRIRLSKVDSDLTVTFSMGIAEASPHLDSVDELINEADKRVYRAKSAGKNQIISGSNLKQR